VDTQLIDEGTYYVIQSAEAQAAYAGWSKRRTLIGSDQTKQNPDPLLDPTKGAA
jgi:hypothetical protein